MREHTPALQSLFPNARIIEFYGASETSFMTWMPAEANVPAQVVGHPFANVEIEIREPRAPDGTGLIYVRSPMVFMDYAGGGHDGTAALRDGDWLSVRDMGRLDAQGRLHMMGRQNRMIVTQGKNLFPEELESVLATHPSVAVASAHGLPHPVRGQQVVAVVQLESGATLTAAELTAWCRERLEVYKVPRRFFACEPWPLTASGKTDHPALEQGLNQLSQNDACTWLRLLH
jgi:long-chain acyl-CoA synthetase